MNVTLLVIYFTNIKAVLRNEDKGQNPQIGPCTYN